MNLNTTVNLDIWFGDSIWHFWQLEINFVK